MRTLTLKGISDGTYRRLKQRAAAEHRSINQQAILMLENELARATLDVKAWLEEDARLRKRHGVKPGSLTMDEINAAKRKGRP